MLHPFSGGTGPRPPPPPCITPLIPRPTSPSAPSAPSPDSTGVKRRPLALPPLSSRLRFRREREGESEDVRTSRALPLRSVGGQMQYWPFSASDLYNWKTHNPTFSQDPQALTGLIESILLTHQPTWDACQQLLQTLLTTEERQHVYLEAWKSVPWVDGRPTQLPDGIEDVFPLVRLTWDCDTAAGRERLHLYRQDRLKALQIIQHQIWKPLAAVYRPGDATDPHPFQIGDSVHVRRHQSRTLESHWKGPYIVLLTTPTALKVDGIAAWVHASHVKCAPSMSTADASQDGLGEPLQWKLHRTQNPFKIRLSKIVQ
ncbi:uncharacterized protein [Vulpes vulpes]|uniref:Uncharacterized protein isoform X2 n=1 Tax=Vulpes vulpes TaxID=9627 RepID=A0ABM4Y1U9_VULVU